MTTPLESVTVPVALQGQETTEGDFDATSPRQSVEVIHDALTLNVKTTPPTVLVVLLPHPSSPAGALHETVNDSWSPL